MLSCWCESVLLRGAALLIQSKPCIGANESIIENLVSLNTWVNESIDLERRSV